MTQLLVSVRSAAEAEIALKGGAALIDVKEPGNGPLGKAPHYIIDNVIQAVAGRVPVSAAMGELHRGFPDSLPRRLAFLKWGLARMGSSDWRSELLWTIERVEARAPGTAVVIVAYADWVHACAPPVEDVCDFALQRPGSVLLLDTFRKRPLSGRLTSLDYLSPAWLTDLCRRCHASCIRVALAGSLGRDEIDQLLPAAPDWFAVRGAVCQEERRGGSIEASKVRALAELIGGITATIPAD